MERNVETHNLQNDEKQHKLLEFFELLDKPMWQITLNEIVKSKKMNVWEVDVKLLAQEYMERLSKEMNINNIATGLLLCSILLKYKSRRMGLKELEGYIEEEIEEIKEDETKIIENLDILQQEGVPLDEFEKTLDKMIGTKTERKKYERKKPEVYIPSTNEDFATTGRRLLEHLMSLEQTFFFYHDLKTVPIENNLFMTLLYLNDDEKVKLEQKEFYGDLKIKVKKQKEETTSQKLPN